MRSTAYQFFHDHYLFYHFYNPTQRKYFSAKLLQTSWVKMLQKKNSSHSIQDAARAYIAYIKAKDDVIEKGILMEQLAHEPKKRKDGELLSQEIARKIRTGTRLGKLMEQYPQMIAKIKQMGCLRPPRAHQTKVLHLYGDPGIGKSYYIQTALQILAVDYPGCDNYFKIGGFSKFWEGYDNQPIVYIDDPVLPDIKLSKDDVQFMKTSMSVGPAQVEIKFGSMQFDSHLIIISSNQTPREIAHHCGPDNADAIYCRLTDTCGSYHVTKATAELIPGLIYTYAKRACWAVGQDIDIEKFTKQITHLEDLKLKEKMLCVEYGLDV